MVDVGPRFRQLKLRLLHNKAGVRSLENLTKARDHDSLDVL